MLFQDIPHSQHENETLHEKTEPMTFRPDRFVPVLYTYGLVEITSLV